MPLVRTNMNELSELFQPYFENCPPAVEEAAAVPIERHENPITLENLPQISTNTNPPAQEAGSAMLLDLSRLGDASLFTTIADDFYAHTRSRADYDVKSIYLLRNSLAWRRYQAEKQIGRQSSQGEEDPALLFRDEILYHGTHRRCVPSILLHGIDPRMTVRANYGKGIYMSDSIEKCMQYVDKQVTIEQEYSIVLCCSLLGKVIVEPYDKSKRKLDQHALFLPEGYHSGVAHDVFKEWVIFEKTQVLPLCVINFTASNRPDSFFRLTATPVLFRGTGIYPSNMQHIPRVCVVPVPVDRLGNYLTISKSEEWRAPDASTSSMLFHLFQIPQQSVKVCNIQYQLDREWAFCTINAAGQETYGYSTDTAMTCLLHLSRNIELLQQRLQEDRQQSFMARSAQRTLIDAELCTIPDGERLVYLVAQLESEYQQHVAQHPAGQGLADNSQQLQYSYLHRLEAWNTHRTASLLSTWSPQHLVSAESVLRKRRILLRDTQGDTERFDRKLRDLNVEKERSRRQAQSCISLITAAELNRRFETAKEQRLVKGDKEDFQMKETEVYTTEIKSWPLIVAELLMPALMITQITMYRDLAVNHTNSSVQVGVHWGATKHYHGNWWEVAPRTVFQAPAASYLFWPINPHRRIPNRRVFLMKDYLEWIFMEKENRIRKQAWHQEQTGSQSRLAPPDDLLQDCDYSTHVQEQWSQMDPSILRAIDGLPSRFGTVVFNREQRQRELDEMGISLLNELFVEAESHMLIRDEVTSPSASLSAKEAPPTTPTADCPICQEVLELDDPNDRTMTRATSPEKVVKLKSCRHCFHDECIKQWFRSKDAQLKCPMCNTMCTTEAKSGAAKKAMTGQQPQKLGPMPDGVMGYSFDVRLACYFIYIVIPAHDIPDPEYQGQDRAPKVTVPADVRYAILPFSARLGPLLMIRLINVFYYGHLFRVGQSLTRGVKNVVIWNGVHLRTSMTGQYGFPAPSFERNCWQEISDKGVAMGLDELMLSTPQPDGSPSMLSTRDAEPQMPGGVSLPANLLEEMAAQDMLNMLFHPDQSLLFGDQD